MFNWQPPRLLQRTVSLFSNSLALAIMFDTVLDFFPDNRLESPGGTSSANHSSRSPWSSGQSASLEGHAGSSVGNAADSSPNLADALQPPSPESAAGSSSSGSRPRRRIRGKSRDPNRPHPEGLAAPATPAGAVRPASPEMGVIAEDLAEDAGGSDGLPYADAQPVPMPTGAAELNRIRQCWWKVLQRWRQQQLASQRHSLSRRSTELLKMPLRDCSKKAKRALYNLFMREDNVLSTRWGTIADAWARGQLALEQPTWLKAQSFMLTWQGDFGLISKEAVLGSSWPSAEVVSSVLAVSPLVHPIRDAIDAMIKDIFQTRSLQKYAWCIELCVESYETLREATLSRSPEPDASGAVADGAFWHTGKACLPVSDNVLRLHVHCFFDFARLEVVRDAEEFLLLGSQPWHNAAVYTKHSRSTRKNYQGFFYCQVRKLGSVLWGANLYISFFWLFG